MNYEKCSKDLTFFKLKLYTNPPETTHDLVRIIHEEVYDNFSYSNLSLSKTRKEVEKIIKGRYLLNEKQIKQISAPWNDVR
ncbi:MAG: hypothetical protein SVM80_13650 [Halobacteriota archaeon]|nr:hypothetical protein [Halobacteriota archaeon]